MYEADEIEVHEVFDSTSVSSVEQNQRSGWLEGVSEALEASRSWAHLHGWETRLECDSAALDHAIIPARESGRSGLHAETGRVGVWAGFKPACRKVIPTHCLYCCCRALRALASLNVCMPVCLHGETWLPSSMFQACYMLVDLFHLLFHLIRNLVQRLVPSIESFFHHSIYILHRGLARPKFFFLGDGSLPSRTASLAFRSMKRSLDTSVLMQPSPEGRS